MRQFFILFLIFTCSSVLADHDRSGGHNYNGRTFPCENFSEAMEFAEDYGGAHWYNFAFCQLHRGPKFLFQGISTLQGIADNIPLAAVEVAEYYSSGGYSLPMGEVTENEADLLESIKYKEKALKIMSSSQSNYPFNSSDDFRIEKEEHHYLNTSANLLVSYMALFTVRSITHIESIGGQVKVDTLSPLNKVIEAASKCLAIPYDSRLWSRGVYNNTRARCTEDKETAQRLLPLERQRLQAALTHCRGKKLSSCGPHNTFDRQIEQIYNNHLDRADRLLAAL